MRISDFDFSGIRLPRLSFGRGAGPAVDAVPPGADADRVYVFDDLGVPPRIGLSTSPEVETGRTAGRIINTGNPGPNMPNKQELRKGVIRAVAGIVAFILSAPFSQAARGFQVKPFSAETQSVSTAQDTALNPALYNLVRSAAGTLFLIPRAWQSRHLLTRKDILTAALGGTSTLLWSMGWLWTDPASAVAIGYSFPIFLAAGAWMKGRKTATHEKIAFGSLAAGLFLIFKAGSEAGKFPSLGNLAVLGGGLLWAAYITQSGNAQKGSAAALTCMSNLFSIGLSALAIPFLPGGLGHENKLGLAMAVLNGFSVTAATYLITRSREVLHPLRVGLISMFEVLLSPLASRALFAIPIPLLAWVGSGFVFFAGLLDFMKAWKESNTSNQKATK